MNFYSYPEQTSDGQYHPPKLVHCTSTFNNPVCYS